MMANSSQWIEGKLKKHHIHNVGIMLSDEEVLKEVEEILENSNIRYRILNIESAYHEIEEQQCIQGLIIEKNYISQANKLQWENQHIVMYICIDTNNVYLEPESTNNRLMNRRLWEFVGNNAKSQVEAGGWISSYTREVFSYEEMQEYADNSFHVLQKHLNSEMKVLEIGCSSGFTMFKIAPYVKLYYGIDMAKSILDKNEEYIKREKIKNITMQCVPAHDMKKITMREFDMVIMNSVLHCFAGYNYVRNVIYDSIDMMGNKGIIYIGDVMDLEKKKELQKSLLRYKENHPDAKVKTKLEELFIPRGFFRDLQCELNYFTRVEFYYKNGRHSNELTKYRYDVLLFIDKNIIETQNRPKEKYQYGTNILQ